MTTTQTSGKDLALQAKESLDNSLATLNDLRQSLAGKRLDVDPD